MLVHRIFHQDTPEGLRRMVPTSGNTLVCFEIGAPAVLPGCSSILRSLVFYVGRSSSFRPLVVTHMASTAYAWRVGPAESRLVRILLYAATALMSAYPIVVMDVINITGQSPRSLLLVLLFSVLLIIVVGRTILAVQTAPTYWVLEDFIEVLQLRWLGVSTLIAVVGLAVVTEPVGVHLAFFLVWFPCCGAVMLLSSRGAMDPEERILTHVTVRRYEIPWDSITAVKPLTAGRRTYLWLSFQTTDGTPVDRLVMIPTDVFDQTRSMMQPAQIPASETRAERTRQSRVELVAGVLVFGGVSVGLAIMLYFGGAPLDMAIALPLVLFGTLPLLSHRPLYESLHVDGRRIGVVTAEPRHLLSGAGAVRKISYRYQSGGGQYDPQPESMSPAYPGDRY